MPEKSNLQPRPPVVAVVGHIDHGKSSLLDYIRKTNVVEGEAGGITQHLSAYEAVRETPAGPRTITFLDTPGHEAFTAMRSRGLAAADIAILVVSAEEGAKAQTLEAIKLIEEAHLPYVVALTKIDKENANLERAKSSLVEHGVYVEGFGGTVSSIGVSSKTGEGIPELLDLVLLTAELEEIAADPTVPAEGAVIEAHVESKRGCSATLIVRNGTLRSGQYVVVGNSFAPVRIMENFLGKAIREATPGMPVGLVGFSSLPEVGGIFHTVETKKEAEALAHEAAMARTATTARKAAAASEEDTEETKPLLVPIIIKADTAGTADAVAHEIAKLPPLNRLEVRILSKGVGKISESDVKEVGSDEHPGIVIGFNAGVESTVNMLAERLGVTIASFEIIYKLSEWLAEELEKRRPRERIEENTGVAKILKIFSVTKHLIVLGGRVESGSLAQGDTVRVMRRELDLGRAVIENLQSQRAPVKKVDEGSEFGAQVRADISIAAGDRLEAFTIVTK